LVIVIAVISATIIIAIKSDAKKISTTKAPMETSIAGSFNKHPTHLSISDYEP
jgi:hypothetical protein